MEIAGQTEREEKKFSENEDKIKKAIPILETAAMVCKKKAVEAFEKASKCAFDDLSGNGVAASMAYRRTEQEWKTRQRDFEGAAKILEQGETEKYGSAKATFRAAEKLIRETTEFLEAAPRASPPVSIDDDEKRIDKSEKSKREGENAITRLELKGKEAETAEALKSEAREVDFSGAKISLILNPMDALRRAGRETNASEGQRIVTLRKKGVLVLLANKGNGRICIFTDLLGKETGSIHWTRTASKKVREELLDLAKAIYGDEVNDFYLPDSKPSKPVRPARPTRKKKSTPPPEKKTVKKKAEEKGLVSSHKKENGSEDSPDHKGNGKGNTTVPQLFRGGSIGEVAMKKFVDGVPEVLKRHAEETLGDGRIGTTFFQIIESHLRTGGVEEFLDSLTVQMKALSLVKGVGLSTAQEG